VEAQAFLHTCIALAHEGYLAKKGKVVSECSLDLAKEIHGECDIKNEDGDYDKYVYCGQRITLFVQKPVMLVGRIAAETDVLFPGDSIFILRTPAGKPVSFGITWGAKMGTTARFGGGTVHRTFSSVTAMRPQG